MYQGNCWSYDQPVSSNRFMIKPTKERTMSLNVGAASSPFASNSSSLPLMNTQISSMLHVGDRVFFAIDMAR